MNSRIEDGAFFLSWVGTSFRVPLHVHGCKLQSFAPGLPSSNGFSSVAVWLLRSLVKGIYFLYGRGGKGGGILCTI